MLIDEGKFTEEYVVLNPDVIKIKVHSNGELITEIETKNFPLTLSIEEMMGFIEKNKLRDGFGIIDYQGAKDIAGAADKFILKEIPMDKFDWLAEPRKKINKLPVIALDLGDGDYEILDGKHRIGEAKARGKKTIFAYVGVEEKNHKA